MDFTAEKKYCALTFDDGPDARMTPRVLERLERYGAKATFMLVGKFLSDGTAQVAKRIIGDGCEVGNHSWDCESLDKKDAKEIERLVNDTSEAIEKFCGTRPAFFRPPNLAWSETVAKVAGLPSVRGIIAFDWAACDTDAQARAKNVLDSIYDGAIILMHDVQPEPHPTPEALDIIIPELKRRGYEFVTLSELFKINGTDPASRTEMWDCAK